MLSWKPELGARFGVLPLDGDGADVTWVETDPCYVFHFMNASTSADGTRVTVDACRLPKMDIGLESEGEPAKADSWLHRFTIDLAAGCSAYEQIAELPGDFPRVPAALEGRAQRFGYYASFSSGVAGTEFDSVTKVDFSTSRTQTHVYGPHAVCRRGGVRTRSRRAGRRRRLVVQLRHRSDHDGDRFRRARRAARSKRSRVHTCRSGCRSDSTATGSPWSTDFGAQQSLNRLRGRSCAVPDVRRSCRWPSRSSRSLPQPARAARTSIHGAIRRRIAHLGRRRIGGVRGRARRSSSACRKDRCCRSCSRTRPPRRPGSRSASA